MKIYFFLFLILPAVYAGSAQNTFQRIYMGSAEVQCFGAFQTIDEGYIFTGIVNSGGYKLYMTRTDCHGEILWSKTYNSSSTIGNVSQRVLQTQDGGFLLAGSSGSFGAYNIAIVRTDANGNVIWQKTMSGPGDDLVNSVVETNDHHFILCGRTTSYGSDAGTFYGDVYLMKLDENGNFKWGKTFGNHLAYDEASDVIVAADGNYAFTGRFIQSGAFHCLLMKTDTAGNMLWAKTFGDTLQNCTGLAVANSNDGGYVITGYSTLNKNNFQDPSDVFLIKTNSLGDTVWCKNYQPTVSDYSDNGSSVIAIPGQGYAIGVATMGYQTTGFVPNKNCVYVTDENGALTLARIYNNGGSHYSYLVTAKGDESYLLSGFTNFYVPDFSTILIKMDDQFSSGCNETDVISQTSVTHLKTKVKIPSMSTGSGGSLSNVSVSAILNLTDTILCNLLSDSCLVFTSTEMANGFEILINPNPAGDELIFDTGFSGRQIHFSILDLQGREIKRFSSISGIQARVSISDLLPGCYWLTPMNEKQMQAALFLKL